MRSVFLFFIYLLGFVYADVANSKCVKENMFNPGHCVGRICIGEGISNVNLKIGEPQSRFYKNNLLISVWNGKYGKFFMVVFDDKKVVDIHFNSAEFKSCDGKYISVRSSIGEVVDKFSSGKGDDFTVFFNNKNYYDWDVPSKGITFTFSTDKNGPISRISIHRIGGVKKVGYSDDTDNYWFPNKIK